MRLTSTVPMISVSRSNRPRRGNQPMSQRAPSPCSFCAISVVTNWIARKIRLSTIAIVITTEITAVAPNR